MLFAQPEVEIENAKKAITEAIGSNTTLWMLVAGVVGVGVAALVVRKMLYRREAMPDLQKNLREDLREYPPPPGVELVRQLTVNNMPVRVRLVVVVPTGKAQDPITVDMVPSLLDSVQFGLSEVLKTDKPRIKVWPTQLSVSGFAPTFHRLVTSGDEKSKSSRWIKVAGPAKTGQRPILLGLALRADDACEFGEIIVQDAKQWGELLDVAKT